MATEPGFVIHNIWLLRLRALLARARDDATGYRDYRDRYSAMATSLGFEGHIVSRYQPPRRQTLCYELRRARRERGVAHPALN